MEEKEVECDNRGKIFPSYSAQQSVSLARALCWNNRLWVLQSKRHTKRDDDEIVFFFWEENASLSLVSGVHRPKTRVRGIHKQKSWNGVEKNQKKIFANFQKIFINIALSSFVDREAKLSLYKLDEWVSKKREDLSILFHWHGTHRRDGISSCRTKRREMEIFHKNERAKPTILLGCHELWI